MRKLPDGSRYCNCPVWAISRLFCKGGQIHCRLSRHVRWKPHFAWSSNGQFRWGYVPLKHRSGFSAVIHSLWFRGRIKQEPVARERRDISRIASDSLELGASMNSVSSVVTGGVTMSAATLEPFVAWALNGFPHPIPPSVPLLIAAAVITGIHAAINVAGTMLAKRAPCETKGD